MREMKNSGIEWIADIPSEWIVRKLKCFAKIGSGEIISKEEYVSEGEYPVIGSNGEIGRTNKYNNFQNVITTGRVGTVGTAHLVKQAWITDNALILQTKDIHEKFLYYVIPNFDFDFMISGTAQPLITATKLKNQFIPVPNLYEQIRIADYLDEKCAEIDTVIEKTKATIEEYKKLKQSVITQAVTKGIRPNRPMKDSGIEWIGEIPVDYGITSIGRMCFVTKLAGFEFTNDMMNNISENADVPIVRAQNVKMGRFINTINEYIPLNTSLQLSRCALDRKCILITFIGAGIGEVAIFNEPNRHHLAPNVAKIVVNLDAYKFICEEFLLYFLMSSSGQEEINKIKKATAQPSLSMETIRSIKMLIPNQIEEQKEIVDYLDKKCSEIDELIAKKTSLLSELESYKKSLIYEYVTGKKEV